MTISELKEQLKEINPNLAAEYQEVVKFGGEQAPERGHKASVEVYNVEKPSDTIKAGIDNDGKAYIYVESYLSVCDEIGELITLMVILKRFLINFKGYAE